MNHNVNPSWAVQQSLASFFELTPMRVGRAAVVGIQGNITAASSLNGTILALGRIRDFNAPVGRATVPFVPIDTATATLTTTGGFLFNFGIVGYNEVILRWTPTAGSGMIDVYFWKKEYQ